MTEKDERTEDVERVTSDAPAEGAEEPGRDETGTTPHGEDPAEGVDPEEPVQR